MKNSFTSYDYARRQGVLNISWEDFGKLAAHLAELVVQAQPEAIVGIARAGLFPAAAVACTLRRELFPTRITRRLNDQVVYTQPIWKTPLSPEVTGKTIVIVDEIADSGETLELVATEARRLGAAHVLTACLISHTWARPSPDFSALVSDAFVIFPWDAQVFLEGKWQPHPEIVAGLEAQFGKIDHLG